MTDAILGGLRWLGLDWDEGPEVGGAHGPYFQAERSGLHRDAAGQLVASGHAYYCYCTAGELAGEAPCRRSGRRRVALRPDVSRAQRRQTSPSREAAGEPRTVRVLVPEGETTFDDMVRGRITIPNRHDRRLHRSSLRRLSDVQPVGRRATTWAWRSRT